VEKAVHQADWPARTDLLPERVAHIIMRAEHLLGPRSHLGLHHPGVRPEEGRHVPRMRPSVAHCAVRIALSEQGLTLNDICPGPDVSLGLTVRIIVNKFCQFSLCTPNLLLGMDAL
jgi:hypothetical protein